MARINKDAIAERVLEFDNFETKKQATEFVEDFFAIIRSFVIEGNEVTIPGFGKFEKSQLANGKNVPKFRAYGAFKTLVGQYT